MIDWLDGFSRHLHGAWSAVASGMAIDSSVVASLAKISAPVIIFSLCGATAWIGGSVIEMKSALAVINARETTHVEDIASLKHRFREHDALITNSTDDRWRRRDHDAWAAQLETRLQLYEQRMNAQRADIADIQRRVGR